MIGSDPDQKFFCSPKEKERVRPVSVRGVFFKLVGLGRYGNLSGLIGTPLRCTSLSQLSLEVDKVGRIGFPVRSLTSLIELIGKSVQVGRLLRSGSSTD